MKNYSIIGVLFIFMTGCFATLPPKVNEVYLNDKTAKDAAKLEIIEKEIIAITNEKENLSKSLKINRQSITIAKKERNRIEAVEELLKEKQKLYILKEDKPLQQETRKKIETSRKDKTATNSKIEYLKAEEDYLEKKVEVKEAELAVKVAEQYLLQAKIARANQEKMLSDTNDKKEKKDLIDVATYRKYYDDQKAGLEGSQKKLVESSKRLKQAEKKLQKPAENK